MSIKIIHTADNHIGISYNTLGAAKEKLQAERINSLKRIVDYGNENNCNFLVIAGDLFDVTTVSTTNIKKVIEVIKTFTGEVIIIPGNHDFFEDDPNSLWSKFKLNLQGIEHVKILHEYEIYNVEINDINVNFFPAPCRSKHSSTNEIGWVKNHTINKEHINVGIAHGNVVGLGRDENNNYFNMEPQELHDSEVDFWLLGHIHVPYPITNSINENPKFFMSGTHMPDSWKSSNSGNAWLIEVDKNKNVQAKRFQPSEFKYVQIEKEINSPNDIENLSSAIYDLDTAMTALKIRIKGRLSEEHKNVYTSLYERIKSDFLYVEEINEIESLIDLNLINATYPDESLPNILLKELLNEEENIAVQLVYETLQKMK